MKRLKISGLFVLALFVSACANAENETSDVSAVSGDKVMEIAAKAYNFAYPMILMDYTKQIASNVAQPNSDGYAPVNQIGHFRQFPDDKFNAVVKPNVDTYYSNIWYDLKAEPVVLTVPATDRYYLLPYYDAYSNIFFVPGPRTTGTGAHTFLLTGPSWQGVVPEGMTQVKAPTNMVWMIGRTQVNSAEDGATVVAKFQDGMKLDLLSQYGKKYIAAQGVVSEEAKKIVPVENTRALNIAEYFTKLAQLMVDNPPAEADVAIVAEMKSIGIEAGKSFSLAQFSPQLQEKLKTIPEQEHQKWIDMSTGKRDAGAGVSVVNNWILAIEGMGSYGTNYDFRAFVAFIGLGANLAEDAIYPSTSMDSDGNSIDGKNNYVLHFEKNAIPPVKAFWSLTAYNSRDFLIKNSINRFALGDRDNLKFNEDGSLDLYIQNSDPKGDKTSNWLPSTQEGLTNLTLRLYWPKESALDKSWIVPAVKKVQ